MYYSKLCTLSACPVDGGFGEWGEWSTCSSSCGGGVSTRQRSCDNPTPSLGGKPCDPTLAVQTQPCNSKNCPICKEPELREGQKEWNCSTDSSGLQTCNIVCLPGRVLMPSTDNIFQCGPNSNYTWSQQTKDNPTGLTPTCSDKKIPESVSPVITTTYDVDCNKPPASVALESSIHNQISEQDFVKQGNSTFTVTSQLNCNSSIKRSSGTMVVKINLNPVGYSVTEKKYFGSLTEQERSMQVETLMAVEQLVQSIGNNSDKIFTATIGGVKYTGQIQSVVTKLVCQPGSGFVQGFCGSYSSGNGSCFYCDKGFYQDQSRSQTCKACPTGTTTSGRGSYSLSHCSTKPISYADIYPLFIEQPAGDVTTKGQKYDNTHDEGKKGEDVPVGIIAAVTTSAVFLLVLGIVLFIVIQRRIYYHVAEEERRNLYLQMNAMH